MPAELASDAVGDSGDELSSEAELRAQLQRKRFWRVLLLRHVPLKLVHQGNVSHVDVQLATQTRAVCDLLNYTISLFFLVCVLYR